METEPRGAIWRFFIFLLFLTNIFFSSAILSTGKLSIENKILLYLCPKLPFWINCLERKRLIFFSVAKARHFTPFSFSVQCGLPGIMQMIEAFKKMISALISTTRRINPFLVLLLCHERPPGEKGPPFIWSTIVLLCIAVYYKNWNIFICLDNYS